MTDILLKNIMLDGRSVDIRIEAGRISSIVPAGGPAVDSAETMDCTGKVAVPGFINMHTHAAMSLMRGIGEDVVFADWLRRIWDIEAGIDHDFIYWGSRVAAIEMIRTGTTTFNDQYWSFPSTVQAVREAGIRVATGYDVMDKDDPETAERQKEQCVERYEMYKAEAGDRHIFTMSFHAVYSVSEPMITWTSEFAKERDLPLHIHLCETRKEVDDCRVAHGGLTPVEYLDRLGVLDHNVIAGHTLWLTSNDIRILGERKVNCVHNINSNAKLCSGYHFPYDELRDAGANVCLGTDGCASSNNLDMLEAMKTSALFQKAVRNDPKAMPLDELIDMATVNGARALRINAGRIAEGCVADISIIDTDSTFFLSPGPFLANFIYSAHSDCIDSVIAGGRFVMKHRMVEGEEEVLREARKVLSQIHLR